MPQSRIFYDDTCLPVVGKAIWDPLSRGSEGPMPGIPLSGYSSAAKDPFSIWIYAGTERTRQLRRFGQSPPEMLIGVRLGGTDFTTVRDIARGLDQELLWAEGIPQASDSSFGLGSPVIEGDRLTIANNYYYNFIDQDYVCWGFREGSGLDIVLYTGDGNTNQLVAHGLGSTPSMIWVKPYDATGDWQVYLDVIGNTGALALNTTAAPITGTGYWDDTSPDGSNFTVGTDLNANGTNYVAYLWGGSRISTGSYTGDGVGQSITTTQPGILLIKGDGQHWVVFDEWRNPEDPRDLSLQLSNTSSLQLNTISTNFTSSGFDVDGDPLINDLGTTYYWINWHSRFS